LEAVWVDLEILESRYHFCTEDAAMKKIAQGPIANQERNRLRKLRLTVETVRLLGPEALAQAMSGCDSTTNPTQAPAKSAGC
jgi:uncharacterized protein with ACT and thioredoxin-like domain